MRRSSYFGEAVQAKMIFRWKNKYSVSAGAWTKGSQSDRGHSTNPVRALCCQHMALLWEQTIPLQ